MKGPPVRLLFILLPATALFCWLTWQIHQLLDELPGRQEMMTKLQAKRRESSTLIYDRSGKILAEISGQRKIPVPFNRLPEHLIQAFLHAEDQHFYSHGPVSFPAMIRALWSNLKNRKAVQGASTITQQLARIFFLNRRKTLRRKILEAALALRLEDLLSKQQILGLYLNHIYLGRGAFGVEAAARVYFGKSSRHLTIAEAALLAALPRAPSALAPHRHPERAQGRRDHILGLMQASGYLSQQDWQKAVNAPLRIIPSANRVRSGMEWFTARVTGLLKSRFSGLRARRAGLQVATGMDPRMNLHFAKALSAAVKALNQGRPESHHFELAHLCVDLKTSLVSCMQGARSFTKSQFNRVYHIRRSPGSLLLPVIYDLAWRSGVYASAQGGSKGLEGLWDDLYYSEFSQANALEQLLGVPRIIGRLKASDFFREGPINHKDLLAGASASPASIAEMMLSIFQGAAYHGVNLISSVRDAQGLELLRTAPGSGQAAPVISAEFSGLLRAFFEASIRQSGRGFLGLVGVSEDLKNVWFAGSSRHHLHVLWVGSEFGRSKIAEARGDALNWIRQLARRIFPAPERPPSVAGPARLPRIGFRRYQDRRGRIRTVPAGYF